MRGAPDGAGRVADGDKASMPNRLHRALRLLTGRRSGSAEPERPAPATLLFDVYGTLVDPAGMAEHLAADVGAQAADFAALWREKQLEYSFRRGLMQAYVPFAVCTAQALAYCCERLGVTMAAERREALLEAYGSLPAFADAAAALQQLRAAGHPLFAFSNGTAADVEAVLRHAGLLDAVMGVISVDALRTFKPAPAVYAYARRESGAWGQPCWLISSNPFDVIGARAAGLFAAWVQRSAANVLDPWDMAPSLTVSSLTGLVDRLTGRESVENASQFQ
jgi:2-haloacid dehalogenase